METLNIRELIDRTPATRNRYIDFLRLFAILVVVFGHWLMAGVQIEDGVVDADNVLELVPNLQYLTWLLQVMPVFFIVGGYANAASWESAVSKGRSYSQWLRGRMTRLLQPVLIFVTVWTVVTVVLSQVVRLDTDLIRVGMQVIAVPVWFLAVYLLVIPAVPVMLRLHRRYGAAVIGVSIAAAVVVDRLIREGGLDVDFGLVNYVFVWFAVHQLGFFWREGRLRGRALTLASAGLVALIALSASGWYVRSLIGVGDEIGNTQPPSVMLFAVALLQLGLALALEAPMTRWLERPAAWGRVVAGNAMIMTIYLWHLPAMVLVILGSLYTGVGLRSEVTSSAWWWSRPLWLLALVAATAPLVAGFLRIERRSLRVQPRPGSAPASLIGAVAAALGMAWLAKGGFYSATGPLGLAIVPLGLIAGAAVLLGQVHPSPRSGKGG
jgi:fucose 4-O-acetylase-like acetyltransferase